MSFHSLFLIKLRTPCILDWGSEASISETNQTPTHVQTIDQSELYAYTSFLSFQFFGYKQNNCKWNCRSSSRIALDPFWEWNLFARQDCTTVGIEAKRKASPDRKRARLLTWYLWCFSEHSYHSFQLVAIQLLLWSTHRFDLYPKALHANAGQACAVQCSRKLWSSPGCYLAVCKAIASNLRKQNETMNLGTAQQKLSSSIRAQWHPWTVRKERETLIVVCFFQ